MAKPRELLGATQTSWLQQRLAASQATWQVLGQQVLMGRMNIPAPILLEGLKPGSGVSASAYAAMVAKAQSAPATLTPVEQAVLAQPAIPYNRTPGTDMPWPVLPGASQRKLVTG